MPPTSARSRPTTDNTPAGPEVLAHLDVVLNSPEFASSSRCSEFLRYVASEVLAGRRIEIKERTIAVDVFGKDANYNPNEYSLVRVKASEVRRRLAKYYEGAGKNDSLRIVLPVGSYVPKFERVAGAEAEAAQQSPPPRSLDRRSYLIASVGTVIALGGGFAWWRSSQVSSLDRFWAPVHANGEALLIFLPILRSKEHSALRSDRVGVGAASACVLLADRFARAGKKYKVRVGDDLTFSDLRRQPAILLGNFLSYWTKDMNRDLRFIFEQTDNGTHIQDTKTGKSWYAIEETSDGYAAMDYALVTRAFDSKTGQILIIASGITTFGTQAAVDFLVDPQLFSQLSNSAPVDWTTRNLQVLLSTRIIGATPGPARVVTAYYW